MNEIPTGVLNKGMTGCGATTLAIEQPGNTILAVPFTGLIDNKVAQYPRASCPYELLGIYGTGNKEQEIKDYLECCQDRYHPYKIATTYDSLPKVNRILESNGVMPRHDSHLAIDEWHCLFNAYDFRYEAIRGVLDLAPQFDKVS